MDCLFSLEEFPNRCALAREAEDARREIRCLFFGKSKHAYRIFYQVDETIQTVWSLPIVHGALDDPASDSLSQARPD